MTDSDFIRIDDVAAKYGLLATTVVLAANAHKVPILIHLSETFVRWTASLEEIPNVDEALLQIGDQIFAVGGMPFGRSFVAPPVRARDTGEVMEVDFEDIDDDSTVWMGEANAKRLRSMLKRHIQDGRIMQFTDWVRVATQFDDLDEKDQVRITNVRRWPPRSDRNSYGLIVRADGTIGDRMPASALHLPSSGVATLAKKENWDSVPVSQASPTEVARMVAEALNPDNLFYAPELADALSAWHELYVENAGPKPGRKDGELIQNWLKRNPFDAVGERRSRDREARLTTTIMPKLAKKGGAPKT